MIAARRWPTGWPSTTVARRRLRRRPRHAGARPRVRRAADRPGAARRPAHRADDRPAHSLHLSFAVAGTGGEAIRYEVERTRDGPSFATRRVVARQARGIVAVLTADFHDDEPGVEYETPATPGVPGPDGLARGRYDNPYIESRDVPALDGDRCRTPAGRGSARPRPCPTTRCCTSRRSPTSATTVRPRAAREPHAGLADDARRMSVSLDHSVWFHRPVDVNQWLLSELVPVATGRGRGLSLGTMRTADGTSRDRGPGGPPARAMTRSVLRDRRASGDSKDERGSRAPS